MAEKYPNKIKGMTDAEVDANEARRNGSDYAMVDNNFHPADKGLEASHDDAWGEQLNKMIQDDETRRKGYK